MPAATQAKGLAPEEPARRTVDVEGGIVLVVGMQDEDAVERPSDDRIDNVRLGWNGEAHLKEIRCVVEFVPRIHEGLADRILVGDGRDRRHFGDHAVARDHTLHRNRDVGRIVIEGR